MCVRGWPAVVGVFREVYLRAHKNRGSMRSHQTLQAQQGYDIWIAELLVCILRSSF